MIKELLAKVSAKQDLTFDEAKQAIDEIMSGEVSDPNIPVPKFENPCPQSSLTSFRNYCTKRLSSRISTHISMSSSAP